jgi:hypothetical protein
MNQADAIAITLAALDGGAFAGRVWREGVGPAVVAVRKGRVVDITSKHVPTMRDLCEAEDAVAMFREVPGEDLCSVGDLLTGVYRAARVWRRLICRPSRQRALHLRRRCWSG